MQLATISATTRFRDSKLRRQARRSPARAAVLLAAVLVGAVSFSPPAAWGQDSNQLPISGIGTSSDKAVDIGESDIQAAEEEIWDPIEPVNRGTFWVNDKLDIYLIEPIARGYRYVLPNPVRKGVSNFFSNLRYPVNFVNYLLQLNFSAAAEETGRFLVNTTIGIGGLIDVASDLGLEKGYNDFGLTFAHYGVPPGPYIVIPILGPSNLRDLTGKVGDTLVHPTEYPYYINATTKDFRDWESRCTTILEGLSRRAQLLNAIESAKEASLDYYSFIQATYYQVRHGLLIENEERDAAPADEVVDDTAAQPEQETAPDSR